MYHCLDREIEMSRTALLAATMLATTSAPLLAEKIPAQKVGGRIDWVYDYQRGRSLAKQTGKPMFVVFRCER